MPVQDNSPTMKNVRWYDIRFVYKGESYKIKDGFSGKKYIFWNKNAPNVFQDSDTIPLDSTIVYINNNGVVTTYPVGDGIFIDNSIKPDNTTLFNHMSDQSVHLNKEILTLINEVSSKLENAILRIEKLENK